eukprot:scaffold64940_cov18-Tisochrysis_lutea.AAC.1
MQRMSKDKVHHVASVHTRTHAHKHTGVAPYPWAPSPSNLPGSTAKAYRQVNSQGTKREARYRRSSKRGGECVRQKA